MSGSADRNFDVVIIGGGVIGSAVARELSRYRLRVTVLEKEPDVLCGTSGRNSGVIHSGINNRTGSLMASYCVEGCLGFDQVARELDIPFSRTGKLVIGFSDRDRKELERLKAQGEGNGVPGLAFVGPDEIHRMAPSLRGSFALHAPSTGIVNPFLYTVALAENAHQNGVRYFFNEEATALDRRGSCWQVHTQSGLLSARWIINSGGLFADRIARMAGLTDYTLHPCRGEYFVLDRNTGPLLPLPAYPVPDPQAGGLGIHLTPTTDGNLLIGPSSEYICERGDYGTTQSIMDLLFREAQKILPDLDDASVIRSFSGIRPKRTSPDQGGYADFVIEHQKEAPGMIHLIGMESPGLTSALPIARHVVRLISEREDLVPNPSFSPFREGIPPFRDLPPEQKDRLLRADPAYGTVVCRCEGITEAEVLQAIRNPLGVSTVSGIKHRTRAMTGRCQGGYCQLRIAELIRSETRCNEADILLHRAGSSLFVGKVRS